MSDANLGTTGPKKSSPNSNHSSEVSKIGTYRRSSLLRMMDGRAKPTDGPTSGWRQRCVVVDVVKMQLYL